MAQLYFVAKDRTVHGPITDRKRSTINGKVVFSGTAGRVYTSHNEKGEPISLPNGFVEWAKATKDSNGQSKLQNFIDGGYVVFEPNTAAPAVFARPMKVDLVADAKGGGVTEEVKEKK